VKVELAETARHFVMYDDPEWMYARIDQFLQ
jgi:N-formylmaleamate deformylase